MANEISAFVAASSTGNYALIVNPANKAQAWDATAGAWATKDPTDADQQIALGGAISEGSLYETQYADMPSGLDVTEEYEIWIYDSNNDWIANKLYSFGVTQQRQGEPDFEVTVSNRRDGQFVASPRVRLRSGAVDATVGINVAPLFGERNKVTAVGTPVVESGSSITCTAAGPRDEPGVGKQLAIVELAGTATLDEETNVDVPVTMQSGASDVMRFIIEAPFAASGS